MLFRVDMRRLYNHSTTAFSSRRCRMFIDDNTVFAPFKTCFGYILILKKLKKKNDTYKFKITQKHASVTII